MVVTVKIAPVERWCQCAKDLEFNAAIRKTLLRLGKVSILTESMHIRGNGHGKFWMVEPEYQRAIDAEAGHISFSPAYVCEHMLEMD